MLLETLDLLKNDVIIYSENKFDLERNFKIIYKKSEIKTPKRIDFFEVCNFINQPLPKNMIVYRLLTNITDFDAFSTKYGFFIKTDNGLELIYFDPIFALNDLSNFKLNIDPNLFRFKIQQVGFSSLPTKNEEAFYGEVYAFDLRSDEAKNQNDKIFAKAIFALDESFIDDEVDNSFVLSNAKTPRLFEDKSKNKSHFTKPIVHTEISLQELNEIKLQNLRSNRNKNDFNISKAEKYEVDKKTGTKIKSFSDLVSKNVVGDKYHNSFLDEAENKSKNRHEVILKFNK